MPNIRIQNAIPNFRISNFQSGRAGTTASIAAGTPIGLLLALTYGVVVSLTGAPLGVRPNINIKGALPNLRIVNL